VDSTSGELSDAASGAEPVAGHSLRSALGATLSREARGSLRPLIAALAVLALALGIAAVLRLPRKNTNLLAIGHRATIERVEVPLASPSELDGMSRADVFRFREYAVGPQPALLVGPYQPSAGVFGQVEDRRPWWGIAGQYFYGNGERSAEGPSEESRFIGNPFLLVAAEFVGLSIYTQGEHPLQWDRARIGDRQLLDPNFPFYCRPEGLLWWPRLARAEVTYRLSGHLALLNRWLVRPLSLEDASFDLVAYNARDLGLDYLYMAPQESSHITRAGDKASLAAIRQYLHRGGSCGREGGCNNMSPYVAELSDWQIEALPARAVILLWRTRPGSVSTPADMTFVIRFE
jgi:hypothetical protein